MKLVTKELEKRFEHYPLYSQESKGDKARVLAKFFCCSFTWYVLEAEKQSNGDYLFFGLVDGLYGLEYGYFTLSEIAHAHRIWPTERDMYFKPVKVSEIKSYRS